jgi:hypothetical protein
VLTLDVATIVSKIPEKQLVGIVEGTSLFGLGYWSITPGMTDIFRFFAEKIFPATRKPLDLFLDLASLRKRSEDDIRKVAAIINKFPDHVRVTLSLNDKEAKQLYEAVAGRKVADSFPGADSALDGKEVFEFLAGQLHTVLGRCHVIIHTPRFAYSIRGKTNELGKDQVTIVPNAYTKQASFTVAAGDAFNGGVAAGILAGCTPEQMLLIGNVTTSQFIRTGVRCDQEQFMEFIGHYKQYLQADHPEIIHEG